ncbi:substrate-binding domain-containing protein [Sulfurovum sp. zt1-1]|uniref:Substrate-binding domain-containing protein n=1 Tax=Sulfurovum zhangzhouensis TaxID=3019067 RepID=A0ABT7R0U0_9BACT|nr:substrate-binding domain-containing protein [Sulfurovum zhangzhouensis]MDM5272394.1 substrate-binding domain-containing protein [Sulfurovum zhangzhouensis]
MKLLRYAVSLLFMVTGLVHGSDKYVVAFAQDTMANDFRKAQVHEVMDTLANQPDIKFIYSDGEGRISLMINQVEHFIEQKVDVLIIGTSDASAIVPIVEKAHASGIKVVILDRGVDTNAYTTFINSDNRKIGILAAEFIAKQLNNEGKVLLFEGLQNADVTQDRSQGFLGEIGKHKKIKVIKRTGNYLRRDAIIEMEKLIEEGVQLDAVFAESDSMLSGVRTVLKRHGIDPSSMIMVGCDYTTEAKESIMKGTQSASILFPLGGKVAAEVAISLLNGESVPKHIQIPVKLVTQENVKEVSPIF